MVMTSQERRRFTITGGDENWGKKTKRVMLYKDGGKAAIFELPDRIAHAKENGWKRSYEGLSGFTDKNGKPRNWDHFKVTADDGRDERGDALEIKTKVPEPLNEYNPALKPRAKAKGRGKRKGK